MSTGLIVQLLAFLFLLAFSAFLSRCEAALLAISMRWLGEQREKRKKNGLVRVLERRQELSLAILSARSFAHVGTISLAALMIARFFRDRGLFLWVVLEILILGAVFLLLVELLPKLVVLRRPSEVSRGLIRSIEILGLLFSPLVKILPRLMGRKTAELAAEASLSMAADEGLKVAMDARESPGLLEQREREMIHSIFEFGETSVKEVMVPRIDMVCADSNLSAQDVLDLIAKSGHSRIPVFKEKIDNIVGLLYAKDLLGPMKKGQKDFEILELVRDVYFVPETKMINELLREFQSKRMHMAIVVDEYGGTSGLVTLEDLLEEIVGEIQDEYDSEEALIKVVDKRTAEVSAKMNLHDLNEQLDLELPNGEFDTLGGLIYDLAGAVPKKGARLKYKNLQFEVLEVRGQRVSKLKIIKMEDREKGKDKPKMIESEE
jgi:putative hemolysin